MDAIAPATSSLQISQQELVKLCAVDTELYAKTYFPQTFRQNSPPFARDMWEPMENPSARLVNVIAFRGSSKTTRLRVFASKRIAYGVSRTILFIGASEADAIRSVTWLRNRIERNHLWRETFGLKRGGKWEETQIEIEHSTFGHTVWVLAAGVNGSLRGINFDDYRPDLIVVDDPQTDESAATEAAREKTSDLILGAVRNSLAPIADEPNAKLVMAITPQHPKDVSQQALSDTEWTSKVYPCWTKETLNLSVEQQVSSWEERFPTSELRSEKLAAMRRNKLSIFTREKECRLISRESAQFFTSWLNIREPGTTPRGLVAVLAIDPVPPPSERQMQKGLEGKDFEAHYVWGRSNRGYDLLDFDRNRGHDPSWTLATAFRLARLWNVSKIIVDAVAYQRVLKWLLEQEMKKRRQYYTVIPVADGMQKFARITSAVGNLASNGQIWVGPEHTVFMEQFEAYGPTYAGADDDLDASALALQELSNPFLQNLDERGLPRDDDVEDFPQIMRCP